VESSKVSAVNTCHTTAIRS